LRIGKRAWADQLITEDKPSYLADLFVAMNPGVSRVRFQGGRAEVGDLQLCRRRLHFYLRFQKQSSIRIKMNPAFRRPPAPASWRRPLVKPATGGAGN
jgi:hypothetical protein